MNCMTCLFAEKRSGRFICRRYPPAETRVNVRADDWCGEYKEKLTVKADKPAVKKKIETEIETEVEAEEAPLPVEEELLTPGDIKTMTTKKKSS